MNKAAGVAVTLTLILVAPVAPARADISPQQCIAEGGAVVQNVSPSNGLPEKYCQHPNVCYDDPDSCFTTPSCQQRVGLCLAVAVDPNDKVGSTGVAAARFVTAQTPFRYVVLFENEATASAPAETVLIRDQLNAQQVDLATLSLGPISVGDIVVTPPPGVSRYSTTVDLRPAQNLVLGVDARLDQTSGLLTWRFTSLDPLTMQLTTDPLAGFLPPNTSPPGGQGNVVFTVQPTSALPTGTVVCNQASVVFDVNAPISTPQWCNTLDTAPPASHVLALPVSQSTTTFPVQWAGSDPGSGVQSFTVFVSEDGGPFAPFVQKTASTSAPFTGQIGKTYGFFSLATDAVGNVESKPAAAEASTRLVAASVPGDLNGDGVVNCTDLAIVKASFGKRAGSPGFDPRADVNRDGIVNVIDLAFVSQRLPAGTKCP